MRALQKVLTTVFPEQCAGCRELLAGNGALCAACWRDVRFIGRSACDTCGVPLPGEASPGIEHCDDCLVIARPCSRGRAAFVYSGTGRRLVLGLKHGDRLDLVPIAARWLGGAAGDLLHRETAIIPVPIHWSRLLRRRYNQSAELARAVAAHAGCDFLPETLKRIRKTPMLDGLDRDARFRTLTSSILPSAPDAKALAGRSVVIVDDVMTSGATLAATAEAARSAGAKDISVLVLARVAKDP